MKTGRRQFLTKDLNRLPTSSATGLRTTPKGLKTNQATKSTGTVQSYSNSTRALMFKNETNQ